MNALVVKVLRALPMARPARLPRIRMPLLLAGLLASLAAAACSGEAVSDPAPATITEPPPESGTSTDQSTIPAAGDALAPSTGTAQASPTPVPQKDRAEEHPYAQLWRAALQGTSDDAVRARTEPIHPSAPNSGQPSSPGAGSPLTAGVVLNGQEPLAGNRPEGEAAADDATDEAVSNGKDALPEARHWRNEDLAELAPYLQGIASWYGPTFHGKLTANGETYNQYGLTAAHPVLPIGTHVLVENLSNGRKVWLRINDRGPYAKGRVLDLSRLAAERLGMIENGTAPVKITVLRWPDTVQASLGLKAYQQFTVQAAAYPDLDTAEELRERLQARFVEMPFFIDHAANGFFAVAAGPFDDEREAKRASARIHRTGVAAMVKRYRN